MNARVAHQDLKSPLEAGVAAIFRIASFCRSGVCRLFKSIAFPTYMCIDFFNTVVTPPTNDPQNSRWRSWYLDWNDVSLGDVGDDHLDAADGGRVAAGLAQPVPDDHRSNMIGWKKQNLLSWMPEKAPFRAKPVEAKSKRPSWQKIIIWTGSV